MRVIPVVPCLNIARNKILKKGLTRCIVALYVFYLNNFGLINELKNAGVIAAGISPAAEAATDSRNNFSKENEEVKCVR